ncbi:hypothetical protein [Jeotgalibacillus campisalis]|uniref:Uncharacterized protein n=1 Tax=Jeotgalibacillus campisalis TaxID=220754 RepID=A0A0C2VTX7_9BACL|nr:hypothetical protein [Jeotgalibacillus campisalis]KIL47438.1 hypothetical protein KR50_16050 [Jeotgalibacillus campisalis]
MGYIAPVNNYQYQQYAERDAIKGYDPFYLTPVQKISPYRTSSEELEGQPTKEKDQYSFRAVNEDNVNKSNTSDSSFVTLHLIPKYTGKGRLFNESV